MAKAAENGVEAKIKKRKAAETTNEADPPKKTKSKEGGDGRIFKKRKQSEAKKWRELKVTLAERREKKLLKERKETIERRKAAKKAAEQEKKIPYVISIAVPGAFLNNAQSAELRTYMAGQVARAATLFCVEEIIVYDETSRMTKEKVDAYYSGGWHGDVLPADTNFESCFYLAKILEYLECPQYLRKQLFNYQKPLKYAGLLNPLDSQHHLKGDDMSIPFREGVVLDKPVKDGRGPLCDIGLKKEFQIETDIKLPPGTRVTCEIANMNEESKRYRGKLTSAARVREQTGKYWGYSVRIATSLKEVIDRNKYNLILGTSPRGKPVKDVEISMLSKNRILIVFGGVQGVDSALESEESIEETSAEEAFDILINSLPNKGSRTERVEENILISLSEVSMRLEQLL